MPSILSANTLSSGFNVANSCRFNSGSSDNLQKTPSGDGNKTTFSVSTWVKRSKLGAAHESIWSAGQYQSTAMVQVFFESDDTIHVSQFNAGGGQQARLTTNRLFRDVSAWYHIVAVWDTTQGTDTNRLKLYVNGVQETSFSTAAYPSQNDNTGANTSSIPITIGNRHGHSLFFSGYQCECVLLDGTAAAITDLGEFDEDSGIWKPIDVSGLTFGTNGYYLDFEDSANLGNDANGGTDFTENNLTAIDQSTDTCTNNFATLNPLRTQAGYTKVMSEGNCVWEHGQAGQNASITSTIAASSGKWYAEFLCSTNANNWGFGIAQVNVTNNGSMAGYPDSQGGVTYTKNGNLSWYAGGDQSSGTGTTFATNDIIAILMDLDNTRVYWYKNDTLVNSGGFNYSVVNSGSTLENNYYFMAGSTDGGSDPILVANYGSPSYAISSGNTDGNGYGNFEFATKGGYALNTKNLAEYG